MPINPNEDIVIGENVWICSGSKIYKGVKIADGCILASDSHIHKSVKEKNCIVTGMPMKIIRSEIMWKP